MKNKAIKMICALALCAMMVFSSASAAFALVPCEDIHELLRVWNELYYHGKVGDSPYPDYICGVYSSDGNPDHLTISLVDGEEGRRGVDEIRSLLKHADGVTFTFGKYPYHELSAIMAEIAPYMGSGSGIWSIGIDEKNNRLNIEINPDNPNSDRFALQYLIKYADRVYFDYGNGYVMSATEYTPDAHVGAYPHELFALAIMLAAALLCLIFKKRGGVVK